jgi:hypothetical protein
MVSISSESPHVRSEGATVTTPLQLQDIRRAWEARDPDLVRLIEQLAEQPEPKPETPIREGALTFRKFLTTIQGRVFHRKPAEEQAHYRIETMKALEAPNAEVPLSDKLRLHEIIYQLWQDNTPFTRNCLLQVIAKVKLAYGPWRALKRIFKEAEARNDTEVFGALAARFDMAFASSRFEIGRLTLGYLCRRAWRYYRRLGVQLPAAYADAAVDALIWYENNTNWYNTWTANHILYHETKQYGRTRFHLHGKPDMLKSRAYEDLWKRTPRPLFALLERARSDRVWEFATSALKTDFRTVLREVEPAWVARLVNVGSRVVDDFVVWVLNNVPRFEQVNFRTLGLHDAVLRLFDSPSKDAQAYAAEYARTHARDLPVPELIRLANHAHDAVRKLARDLLLEREPRTEVGLEAWGQLLETRYGHEIATGVLRKSFGARELTPAWFKARLFSAHQPTFDFAKALLPQIHPSAKLGAAYFVDLLDSLDDADTAQARRAATFALAELARFPLDELNQDFLKRLLLHPLTRRQTIAWIDEGRLKAQTLGVDFLKVLAFHPAWEADPWIGELRQSPRKWARALNFSEELADQVLTWLRDSRRFSATADLGFDWLMRLAGRGETRYHSFATEMLIRSFVPADFAPRTPHPPTPSPTEGRGGDRQPSLPPLPSVGEGGRGGEGGVDLGGATFVFAGKWATMKREEAEKLVKAANGTVLSNVSAKIHYLVIGDEASPLQGQGPKGTKQEKAEELNAGGANIRIIPERALVQMLRGQMQVPSADATLAGCRRLWDMAVAGGAGDASLAEFARKYIRRHHPDIAQAETDRPVEPGAEIPPSFLTFELVQPLFSETRKPLRDFVLDLAKYEFARWSPPAEALIRLCELPFADVRRFVSQALLAEDLPENRRYRINPDTLSARAVYSFCESPDENTRALGVQLIQRSPRLQVPEELFRLTESPDRKVRSFVIRTLWSLYRDRGITEDWKPSLPPQPTVGAAAQKKAAELAKVRGTGAPPRPEQPPAEQKKLEAFLRRILFEIPPGRPAPAKGEEAEGITVRLKPLPARKAKLSLVEVMRDLALEDGSFARGLLPLLEEFMHSRGKSEHDACLVAVTRIRKTYPEMEEVVSV